MPAGVNGTHGFYADGELGWAMAMMSGDLADPQNRV
jgi:hypothetical protein